MAIFSPSQELLEAQSLLDAKLTELQTLYGIRRDIALRIVHHCMEHGDDPADLIADALTFFFDGVDPCFSTEPWKEPPPDQPRPPQPAPRAS